MTVWNKPISWSKFKLALDCPRQLMYVINKDFVSDSRPNYWAELGTIIQFVFEQIFNQGINLKPGGDSKEVFERATNKILKSQWYLQKKIIYPSGKTMETLEAEVRAGVVKGWEIFKQKKLLNRPIRSEVKWASVFRNMRLFAMIDFVHQDKDEVIIFDGKGNAKVDADERQLLFYGLTVSASGKTVKEGGFLYWKHDYVQIDLTPKKLKEFADGPFTEGMKVMRVLQTGADTLAATPGKKVCGWCPWKYVCDQSTELRPEADHDQPTEVTFLSS